jgi:hypothetical protein
MPHAVEGRSCSRRVAWRETSPTAFIASSRPLLQRASSSMAPRLLVLIADTSPQRLRSHSLDSDCDLSSLGTREVAKRPCFCKCFPVKCHSLSDAGGLTQKSSSRFYRNTFSDERTPTQYELFNKTVIIDENPIDLEIWDTSGKIELNQLSLLSYMDWDAVLLCFSVTNGHGFVKAQTQVRA